MGVCMNFLRILESNLNSYSTHQFISNANFNTKMQFIVKIQFDVKFQIFPQLILAIIIFNYSSNTPQAKKDSSIRPYFIIILSKTIKTKKLCQTPNELTFQQNVIKKLKNHRNVSKKEKFFKFFCSFFMQRKIF